MMEAVAPYPGATADSDKRKNLCLIFVYIKTPFLGVMEM